MCSVNGVNSCVDTRRVARKPTMYVRFGRAVIAVTFSRSRREERGCLNCYLGS